MVNIIIIICVSLSIILITYIVTKIIIDYFKEKKEIPKITHKAIFKINDLIISNKKYTNATNPFIIRYGDIIQSNDIRYEYCIEWSCGEKEWVCGTLIDNMPSIKKQIEEMTCIK